MQPPLLPLSTMSAWTKLLNATVFVLICAFFIKEVTLLALKLFEGTVDSNIREVRVDGVLYPSVTMCRNTGKLWPNQSLAERTSSPDETFLLEILQTDAKGSMYDKLLG